MANSIIEYKQFPSEVKNVIDRACEYYNTIGRRNSLNYINDNGSFTIDLNNLDALSLSLMIAIIHQDNEIRKLFSKHNFSDQKIAEFLNINAMFGNGVSNKNRNIYKGFFIPYLENIAKECNVTSDKPYLMNPKSLCLSLINGVCDSKIISHIYELMNRNKITETLMYSDLLELSKSTSLPKTEVKKTEKKSFYYEKYGIMLPTKSSAKYPLVGRDEEVKKLELALLDPDKSAIIVGDAGVGKTAIVDGLALKIQNNEVPDALKNKKILSLNTNSLVAGTIYRGEFEAIIQKIINEVILDPNLIIFIDEIHSVIGLGTSDKSNNGLSNILKPYLDRGDIKVIGATTDKEYNELIASDPAFRRRFKKIEVKEPTLNQTLNILNGVVLAISDRLKVSFPNELFKYLVNIVDATDSKNRQIDDYNNNPDLAISILNQAFILALYNNRNYVIANDIKEAILNEDRICISGRQRSVLNINDQYIDNKILSFKN